MLGKGLDREYIGTPLGESLELMEAYQVGDLVRGRVVKVDAENAYVNIGLKEDAPIPLTEFPQGVNVNDEIEVKIVDIQPDGEGFVVSYREAQKEKRWEEINKAFSEGGYVEGTVTQVVKGGLKVDLGVDVEAFLPASLISLKKVDDLSAFVSQKVTCKIIEIDREKKRIIVSRRDVQREEEERRGRELLKSLKEGDRVKGRVINITDYGAFVDIGGLNALIHKSELSWKRIEHPSDVLSVGDEVETMVVGIDVETRRVALSLKRVTENPWDKVTSIFKVGEVVKGKVSKIVKYGAFVEIHPDYYGLIHISELSEDGTVEPDKILKEGDEVRVRILDINKEKHRISLSLKGVKEPEEVAKKYIHSAKDHRIKMGDFLKQKGFSAEERKR